MWAPLGRGWSGGLSATVGMDFIYSDPSSMPSTTHAILAEEPEVSVATARRDFEARSVEAGVSAWRRKSRSNDPALWDHIPGVDEAVIPILRVADAEVAVAWYARLGFRKESEHRFAPGLPAFVTVVRGSIRLFLSEHTGDARPDTLIYLQVTNVDALAAEFGVAPEDEPWAREIELRDPDSNRVRIGTPRS